MVVVVMDSSQLLPSNLALRLAFTTTYNGLSDGAQVCLQEGLNLVRNVRGVMAL